MRAPAQEHWDFSYVLASIAISMIGAAAGMRVLLWRPALPGRLIAGLLLVLAICGLHFTGMAAVTLCQIRLSRCLALRSPQTCSPSRSLW